MPHQHDKLDRLKLLSAAAILREHDMSAIRAKSLSNLDRWQAEGTWVSSFDEWRILMTVGTDEEIVRTMIGLDDHSNRMRQSPPYAGLLGEDTRFELLELAGLGRPTKDAENAAAQFLAEEPVKRNGK